MQQNYGLEVKEIELFVQGVQNTNYKINSQLGRFVFRVYNRKKINELRYTINILSRLQVEKFPSPMLVSDKSGKIVLEFERLPCFLYYYLPGRNTESKAEKLLDQLGELQARMHLALRDEKAESVLQNWDPDDLNKIIVHNKERLKFEYPLAQKKVCFIEELIKQVSFSDQLPQGGTHQDIKAENVLVDEDIKICGIIDFDNGYYGTLLHDITTTIVWYCFDNNSLNLKNLKFFLAGYERIRVLTDIERSSIHQAIKFRFLREAIIWYLYVGHDKERAEKTADYFLGLYNNFSITEQALKDYLWT